MKEETGVQHVSLLGSLPPVWSRYGKEVLAHVQAASPEPWPSNPADQDAQLPAFDVAKLEPLDRAEVARIFALTLEELVDESRHRRDSFREDASLPYIVLDVKDKTEPVAQLGQPGAADLLWGLSGWSLNTFARAIGLFA